MNAVSQQEMEQQREALLESIQTLPREVLQELAEFIEYLRHKAKPSAAQPPIENDETEVPYSPYKELKKFGLIGFAEDGPSDFSVNYKH